MSKKKQQQIMESITVTGEQAYYIGIHHKLYRKSLSGIFKLLTFEAYEDDGFIFGRDDRGSIFMLKDNTLYTFYIR